MTQLIILVSVIGICLFAVGYLWLRRRSRIKRTRAAQGWVRTFIAHHYGRVDELVISRKRDPHASILASFKNLVTGLKHRITFWRTKGPSPAEFHSEWREQPDSSSTMLLTDLPTSTKESPTRHIECRENAPGTTIRPD